MFAKCNESFKQAQQKEKEAKEALLEVVPNMGQTFGPGPECVPDQERVLEPRREFAPDLVRPLGPGPECDPDQGCTSGPEPEFAPALERTLGPGKAFVPTLDRAFGAKAGVRSSSGTEDPSSQI